MEKLYTTQELVDLELNLGKFNQLPISRLAVEIETIYMILDTILIKPGIAFSKETYDFKKIYATFAKIDKHNAKLLKNSEIGSVYSQVHTNYAKLMKELKVTSAIKIFAANEYILSKGYLSKNKEFRYAYPEKEIVSNCGLNIMTGRACCRNESQFLVDIYANNGINSKKMRILSFNNNKCTIENKEINFQNEFDIIAKTKPEILNKLSQKLKNQEQSGNTSQEVIEKIANELEDSDKEDFKIIIDHLKENKKAKRRAENLSDNVPVISNHSVVQVKEGRKCYILDPTRVEAYNRKNLKTIQRLDDSSVIEYISDFHLGLYEHQLNCLTKRPLQYDEYRQQWEEGLEVCKNNKTVLEDFYLENRENYQQIDRELKHYGELKLAKVMKK